jgi:hypothetical protein
MRVSSEGGLGALVDIGPRELGSSATPKAAKSHAEGSAYQTLRRALRDIAKKNPNAVDG